MFPFAEVAAFTIRMISSLVFHKNQHAVITNSLKIRLPKVFLAVITISRGCKFVSQWIESRFEQSKLKGHWTKRWKLVSSCPHYTEHSYSHQAPCSFFSISSLCLICLWSATKRRICACLKSMKPKAKRREGRLLSYQLVACRPFYWCILSYPKSMTKCLVYFHPSFCLLGFLQFPLAVLQLVEREVVWISCQLLDQGSTLWNILVF